MKYLEILKTFFLSNKMKAFYWQSVNGFVVILVGTLSIIKPEEVSAYTFMFIGGAIALLNMATKAINRKFL